MTEHKNVVHFIHPYYFWLENKVCRIKFIEAGIPLKLCYINNKLHVIFANYSRYHSSGVCLPIKETENELKENNVEYKLYDRT